MATRKKKSASRLRPVARETRASERKRITEDDVKAAVDILSRDYYQDVHGIGDEIKDAIESSEISTDDQLHDRINQEVDSSQRVIYTFQARCGLLVTNNDEAYENEFGDKPPTVEAQMAYAMTVDIREYIGDVDFDGAL